MLADSFIAIYDDALSLDICKSTIDRFESYMKEDFSSFYDGSKQFYDGFQKMGRHDLSIDMEYVAPSLRADVYATLDKCINRYADTYYTLKAIKARSSFIKLQKTPPKGGYHLWHCESMDTVSMNRALTWMIYLNDVPDGEGETEFLWQGVRIKPKAGTCVLFPTAFTHTHRGNPVYSCDKYIATGWYIYAA